MKYLNTIFIRTILGSIIIAMFWSCKDNLVNQTYPKSNFNSDWKFKKIKSNSDTALYAEEINDESWENITLPHTANIEPAVITRQQWQGICWYRKNFTVPETYRNKHIALYFEGAMQIAELWLNGKKLTTHYGGYLPFYLELTDMLYFDRENVIAVKLNNEDNPQVPPGKPMEGLDFNWYSGLYRNVRLIVKDKIHITSPIEVGIIAGGGVFVQTMKADSREGRIKIRTDVLNQSKYEVPLKIKTTVYDTSGTEISSTVSESQKAGAAKSISFETLETIENAALWSPETPVMYSVKVELLKDEKIIDTTTEKFGLRTIKFDKNGFYLNGEKYNLRGTNRHQEYPYIGYALSDNAQYRDAWKIKQAGFNFVRLSHYPHSESFMDACDELGIFVMDAIPGWQFFGDLVFQERCYNDIRQMVRRNRNHPSVILWEASLNESGMPEEFMDKAHQIVHKEFPGQGVYTCGWIDYAYDVFIPARQHAKAPDYWKKYPKDKPLFIAEYGDWEYYAQNAGFNQTAFVNLKQEERTSRQLRGDGQVRLTQQALNYQESHNDNLYNKAAGDANWLMFDYNRGYAPDIESSGIMDIFRLPKFAYYFYRSQKELSTSDTVLFIANYWNDPNFTDIKVYGNCDEVELWLNNKLIEKRQPDTDRNSTNLQHPPFTFKNVPYQSGELKAKAFCKGKFVAETVRNTPGSPVKIQLSIDESNKLLQANCNDVVFVYATIADEQGNYVPSANHEVTFKTEGDAELIGDNPVKCEAGIATILLKAGKKVDKLKISVSSDGLKDGVLFMDIYDTASD